MWPMYLDMSRDECKRFLRCLELDAYASIVSAFRAQGELNAGKRKLLLDLCASLSISTERHKAEVRRAANDEKLATVAEQMEGPNTNVEWAIEGRRLIPLLPRLVPQTAFTALANNVANATAAENAMLPPPSMTFKKRVVEMPPPPTEPSTPEASKTQSAASSNVMSLPPGTSIQLKRDVDAEKNKKRQRCVTFDDQLHTALGPPAKMSIMSRQQPSGKIMPSNVIKTNPLKITPCRATATTQPSSTQKVIIVSNSTTAGSTSNASILQRSLSVPLVKTAAATCSAAGHHRVGQSPGHASQASTTTVTASYGTPPTTAYITTASGVQKSRPMTVQLPTKPRPRSNSIMIPMMPNQLPSSATVHKATLHAAKPSVHMTTKQETTNVKMLAIGSTATKILPKPSAVGVSPAAATPTIARTVTPRVITVSTTTTPTIHSVTAARQPFRAVQKVLVGGGGGSGLTPVRPAGVGGGGKTNVIVVQKGATSGYARGVTLAHGGKEITRKITLSKSPGVPRGSPGVTTVTVQRPGTPGSLTGLSKAQAIQLPGNAMPGNVIVLDLSPEQFRQNTVLADILQASGILPSDGATTHSADSVATADTECIEVKSSYQHPCKTTELTAIGSNEIVHAAVAAASNVIEAASQPDGERIGTLEQAVTIFGSSDDVENRVLLNQAGVQVADQPTSQTQHDLQTEIVDDSHHQVAHEEDVVCAEPDDVMEVVGELDPQTGVYSVNSAIEGGPFDNTQFVDSDVIFDTALASANINLDTFQYMDEGLDNLHAAIINTDSLNHNEEFVTYSQYQGNEEVQNTATKQVVYFPVHQVAHVEDVVCAEPNAAEPARKVDQQTSVYSIPSATKGPSFDGSDDDQAKLPADVPMVDILSTVDTYSSVLPPGSINLDKFQNTDGGLDNLHAAIVNTHSLNENQEFVTYSEYGGNEEVQNTEKKQADEQPSLLEISQEAHFSAYLQPNISHIENTAVMVEPSNMDTTDMYIEDFTSQKV